MEIVTWLSNWFKENCDGDWEHNAGIKISTLDNPGWNFTVSLENTPQQGNTLFLSNFHSDEDWYEIKCDGNTFYGNGDVSKLNLLIEHFRNFVETTSTK